MTRHSIVKISHADLGAKLDALYLAITYDAGSTIAALTTLNCERRRKPVSEETDRQKERRSKTGRDPFPAMIAAPLESMRSPNASIPDHRNGMDAVELPS